MLTSENLKQQLYTPSEVAKLLKVGYYSIYAKIKHGELEAVQIGRKWLISHQAVLDYLNKRSNRK
jgi:excisionase family DNA binding protein